MEILRILLLLLSPEEVVMRMMEPKVEMVTLFSKGLEVPSVRSWLCDPANEESAGVSAGGLWYLQSSSSSSSLSSSFSSSSSSCAADLL